MWSVAADLILKQNSLLLHQPGFSILPSPSHPLFIIRPPRRSQALPPSLVSFVCQSLQLAAERWARPWASGSPAPWRVSRRPCRRPSRIAPKPRCPSTARGRRVRSGAGVATRVSASPSTSPTTDLLKMVRPLISILKTGIEASDSFRCVQLWAASAKK